MFSFRTIICALYLLAATSLWAVDSAPIANLTIQNDQSFIVEGDSEPRRDDALATDGRLDTQIGDLYRAGMTFWDSQHNGSAGKMIYVDDAGLVHLVWMKGLTTTTTGQRHAFLNIWGPAVNAMVFNASGQPYGSYCDGSASRSGYVCIGGLPSGWVFPAFQENRTNVGPVGAIHSAASMDYRVGTGAWNTTQPAVFSVDGNNIQSVWPKIAVGADSMIHLVSTESPPATGPGYHQWQRIFYSQGRPQWHADGSGDRIIWQAVAPDNGQYRLIDTVSTISVDVAASKTSSRVAIAFAKSRRDPVNDLVQLDNDLAIMLSEDGGHTWGSITNLTNFTSADTFRAYTDVSLVFDQSDILHVAFSTPNLDTDSLGQLYGNRFASMIWHWDEIHQQFSTIADGWSEVYHTTTLHELGAWQRVAQRPSLSVDPITGYLYCSYQHYDLSCYSTAGYTNADAFISVSTDNGVNWSVGRNVTDTYTSSPTPAYRCLSERDITLADRVTYSAGMGYLHMTYVLDLDAGSGTQNPAEGVVTNNNIYYQRISINDIPSTPLQPNFPIHIQTLPPVVHGRCCYGPDINNPFCSDLTSASCAELFGRWDSTLSCETPCPSTFECTCRTEPNTHCNDAGGDIIDGNAATDFVVRVEQQFHITDVNVCLDITHQNDENLVITLQSPVGHTSVLASRQGANGQNYTCTSFDDQAFDSLANGYPPFRGRFTPESPLSVFDGEDAMGDWILHVTDVRAGATGHLNWVCLSFNYDRLLAVELSAFSAVGQSGGIHLSFTTASEMNNARFEIMRGNSQTGSFVRVASLNSLGNSSTEQRYEFVDTDVLAGQTYWYYPADVSLNGERTEHRSLIKSAAVPVGSVPREYSLSVYPNPFNPTTTIEFFLTEAGRVHLEVFNVSGRLTQTLADQKYDAGIHHVSFDGTALPAGVYFARIEMGGFMKTQKMMLLK